MLNVIELVHLIEINKNEEFKNIILSNIKYINSKTDSGNTLLIYAVYFNNIEIVKFLLENGAEKDIKNLQNDTPESIARGYANWQALELLI